MKVAGFAMTLEGLPYVNGVPAALTQSQRDSIRAIEVERRALARELKIIRERIRALPTKAQLAADHNCSLGTISLAARGHVYKRDRLEKVSRETTTTNNQDTP